MSHPKRLIAKKPAMVADVHVKCDAAIKELFAEKLALEACVRKLETILREVRFRSIGFSEYVRSRLDDV